MHPLHRNLLLFVCLASGLAARLAAQNTPTVGGGAPNSTVTNSFLTAYFRNGFNRLVAATPDANVSKYGSTGYYQQFDLATDSTVKLGLVLPTLAAAGTDGAVLQVLNPLYSYYSTVGVNTAGYPTGDTQTCPGVASCQYQLFSLNYALFYYASGNPNGNGFSTSGSIYTAWSNLGGPSSALGMAVNAQAIQTSPAKTTANTQEFAGGIVVNLTSGINSGAAFAVLEPVYDLYQTFGRATGILGMPTSNDLTLPDGSHRQTFEGGRIVYTPGNPPTVLFPVAEIDVSPSAPVNLQYGQTLTVTLQLYDSLGNAAVGRAVSWATSNSSAVTVASNGYSASLKAVGSGTATITATSEGLVSKGLVVTATEPCCQIGQGAPTAAIQQAFQDAVTRNHLTVLIPAATGVRRVAAGYVQDLYSPDGTIHYLVAKSDLSALAYVVTGATLAAYNQSGGPVGTLGYPASDLSSGGTQLFTGGALASNPVQMVAGAILKKWASLNYEAGSLGIPVAAQMPFTSQSAYMGASQSFVGGAIFGISNGNLAGQGFQASGPILARYLALSGPSGEMGVPLTDPFSTNGVARQNFENGYIDLQPGSSTAVDHLAPRTPTISANPSSVLAGSRLHLAITGFNNNAILRVSQTGQPDFLVTVPNGSYQWDIYISPAAAAGTIAIHAAGTQSSTTADGSYTIRSIAAAKPQLTKIQGDDQTAPPGSVVAVPLAVVLADSTGTPISGATVTFLPSPGASVSPGSVVTDSTGRAATALRLPPAPGISAVTAQALGQIAIFNAQSAGSTTLANFPPFVAASPTSAQVAAAAAMIRYYQNQGSMPAANGLATPATLDQFLLTLPDGYLNSAQLVNFWRLVNFTGGNLDVSIESDDLNTVRTLIAAGDPVLIGLVLTEDGSLAGGATVAATGIAADGGITILDPNTYFARVNLNDYLNGFSVNGHVFQATVLSAMRLLPRTPSATGFLLDEITQSVNAPPALAIVSASGPCGSPFVVQNAYLSGAAPPATVQGSWFVYCDGSQPEYQVTVGVSAPYQASLIDLAGPDTATASTAHDLSGSTVTAYQVSRVSGQLSITTPAISFTVSSVLNAASFLAGISPGGLFSLFGSGLSGSGSATTVLVGGQAAIVLLATPFQINAQVPAGLSPGESTVQVSSPYGNYSQAVTLQPASPGIFVIGTASDGTSALGAVVNHDGTLNGATSPARRGDFMTIYCTGLGATVPNGGFSTTGGTVTVILSNTELPSSFSGLAPGFVGLYQVNFPIPLQSAPGLLLPLAVKAGGVTSNLVAVAVQ